MHRYTVNQSQVVHDEFEDGEVALINLQTGTYYSLVGAGRLLWPHLVAGATAAQLVAVLGRRCTGTGDGTAADVERFLGELVTEGLVQQEAADVASDAASLDSDADAPVPYEAPALERFDDLQELLLLDPVHDVSDAGWPHAGTPPTA